jgi:hypothetical protein
LKGNVIHAVWDWFQYPGMLLPENDRSKNSLIWQYLQSKCRVSPSLSFSYVGQGWFNPKSKIKIEHWDYPFSELQTIGRSEILF